MRALAVPFLRPSRVGEEPLLVDSRLTAALFALTYGVVEVRQVLARRDLQGKPDLLHLDTWGRLWLFTLGVGLLWAAFAYFFGGWWFQVRLYLSDVNPIDLVRARNVFLAVCQVTALPGLAWAGGETLFHGSPATARANPSLLALSLLGFAVWTVIAEYRAVLGAFPGDRRKIKIWFLTLPLLWPVLVLALGFVAVAS